MASSVLASQSLILKNPSFLFSPNSTPIRRSFVPLKTPVCSRKESTLFASSTTLSLIPSTKAFEPLNPAHPLLTGSKAFDPLNPAHPLVTGSTRTLTTLLAIVLTASKLFASKLFELGPQLNGIRHAVAYTAGPAFFAAARTQATGSLNTPLTVVAAGLAKWLDIYSGVLMVRVLLSWFPNIPWERQPLSAIRDLCDPYLNLFRNIIPPIFDTLDVSPLLAFAVLGTLGSILNSSRGAY